MKAAGTLSVLGSKFDTSEFEDYMNIDKISLKETFEPENMTSSLENLMNSTATITLSNPINLENFLDKWKSAPSAISLAAPETSLEMLGKSLPLSAVMPTGTTD